MLMFVVAVLFLCVISTTKEGRAKAALALRKWEPLAAILAALIWAGLLWPH